MRETSENFTGGTKLYAKLYETLRRVEFASIHPFIVVPLHQLSR